MSAKARAKVLNDFQKPNKIQSNEKTNLFSTFSNSRAKRKPKKEVIEVEDATTDSSATEISEDDEVVEVKPALRPSRKAKGKGKATVESDYEDDAKDGDEDEEEVAKANTRPTVMLISLKSGSVGINLTAAQVSNLARGQLVAN